MNYKCPICGMKENHSGVCYLCDLEYKYYKSIIIEKDMWFIDKLTKKQLDNIPTYKETYEKVKKHYDKLESKRKYYKGDVITTLDELLEQKFVYWWDRIKHINVVKSLQFRMVLSLLEDKRFSKAIKKEDNNDNKTKN